MHNSGGDWHSGWGGGSNTYIYIYIYISDIIIIIVINIIIIIIIIYINTRKPGHSPTLKRTPYALSCPFCRAEFWLLDSFFFAFFVASRASVHT